MLSDAHHSDRIQEQHWVDEPSCTRQQLLHRICDAAPLLPWRQHPSYPTCCTGAQHQALQQGDGQRHHGRRRPALHGQAGPQHGASSNRCHRQGAGRVLQVRASPAALPLHAEGTLISTALPIWLECLTAPVTTALKASLVSTVPALMGATVMALAAHPLQPVEP